MHDEIIRLKEVHKFLDFDFYKSREYQDITDLASQLCDKPISLITLLDNETNWIKMATGFETGEADRASSFCQYGIQQDELLIIPDATADERFDQNSLVHVFPKVRFYAGAPLILSNGHKIGTLCLFDFKPNNLTNLQQKALTALSRQVIYLMELEFNRGQLFSQIEEINAKNDALRKIAYMQSHQIRQPLSSVMGLVNLVKEGIVKPDEKWIDMIGIAAEQLDEEVRAIITESTAEKDIRLIRFNKMLDEVEDYAIILLDKDGIIENWNKGAEKIKGYTATEIIGKNFNVFYSHKDRLDGLPAKTIACKDGACRSEGYRVRKDGSEFWARVVVTAIHNDSGDVIGFTKVTRDLSDIKETQLSLDVAEERLKNMIEEIEDYAIILLDASGNIEKWNKGAQKIKGYPAEAIIGKNFTVFYPEEDRQQKLPELLLEQARLQGRAHHEGWRLKMDGSKFWGSVVITSIHNSKSEVIGFVKVTKDLTAEKLLM
ncbi:PAS domain S-box protein [Mucilaginibacter paludis]|uniref:histidine kinase n=1 Tax=Mucilaginibacter paludis DSM 18603 TaxID=714943 RepID=H1Y499_9SPHI|nr:PAS domain S-box protein [Mucilaginibacter paludis]EHQ25733.1 putative PAS/PAC sensor protein [Mucilaginibacter paludis DSM 18603]